MKYNNHGDFNLTNEEKKVLGIKSINKKIEEIFRSQKLSNQDIVIITSIYSNKHEK